MKILIVEDNPLLGTSMKQGLTEAGWTVDLGRNGEEGLYLANNSHYDLMLIDRMLPKVSGIELIQSLRKNNNHTPAIMVTAKGELQDRISGLEQGADDYIVKPFELAELIARVMALHRRSLGRGHTSVVLEKLRVEISSREAFIENSKLDLTSKEFDLLSSLAGKPDQVFSRTELSSLLYEFDGEPESNSIDVLMARLRKKIAGSGVEIVTVRTKGFILRVETTTAKS